MSNAVVLVTGGYDHYVRFWEAPRGVCYRSAQFKGSQVNALAISRDKKLVAAAGHSIVRVYEVRSTSAQPQREFTGQRGNVVACGFLGDDGELLWSAAEDGTLRVWQVSTGACVVRRRLLLKTAFRAGEMRAVREDSQIENVDACGHVQAAELMPDVLPGARRLIFGDDMGVVRVVAVDVPIDMIDVDKEKKDAPTKLYKPVAVLRTAHSVGGASLRNADASIRSVSCVACMEEAEESGEAKVQLKLCAVNSRGIVFLWHCSRALDDEEETCDESDRWTLVHQFRAHEQYCLRAKLSPDGRTLATVSADSTCRLWDLSAGTGSVTTSSDGAPGQVVQSPVTEDEQKDADDADELVVPPLLHTLTGHLKWVWDADFSADSQFLVTASSDTTAKLWDVNALRGAPSPGSVVPIKEYRGSYQALTCVALNDE